jgi:hypothetical protein
MGWAWPTPPAGRKGKTNGPRAVPGAFVERSIPSRRSSGVAPLQHHGSRHPSSAGDRAVCSPMPTTDQMRLCCRSWDFESRVHEFVLECDFAATSRRMK